MINKIYNNFLVIEEEPNRRSGKIYYQCKCLVCGTIKSAEGGHIRNGRIRCSNCVRKNYHNIEGEKFGLLTAKYPTKKREFGSIVWFCECDCGGFKEVSVKSLTQNGVKSCGCLTKSVGELNIEQCLLANNIPFIAQYSFDIDKRKKYDFAILNDKQEVIRLIEFDGKQHFFVDNNCWFTSDSLELRQERDKIKNNYAKQYHIPLVRIPYWERDKITLEMILGEQYVI